MTNLIRIVVVLAFSFGLHAQEFNATVVVNAVKTGSESLPIFKNLEKQLTDFINNTSWTGQSLQNSQRINCSFVILVSEYRGDKFKHSFKLVPPDQYLIPLMNQPFTITMTRISISILSLFRTSYLTLLSLSLTLHRSSPFICT